MSATDIIMCGRPKTCRYCGHAYWGLLHMVNYAKNLGYNVDDEIAGTKCVKDNIYAHLNSSNPQMFFGVGHGSYVTYTDNDERRVWTVGGMPPDNLAGRFVYLWSCLTGVQLGPNIVEKGAINYAGFNVSWGWDTVSGTSGDPYDDYVAHGFWESGNEYIKALLDGDTAQQAYGRSYDKYTEWIDYWTTGEGSSNSKAGSWAALLIKDRNGLVLYGDRTARLKSVDCGEITDRGECLDKHCFWYNDECHSEVECGQVTDRNDCLDDGCFWYNEGCHSEEPDCEILETPQECDDNNCFWYRNSCHSEPLPPDDMIDIHIQSTLIPSLRVRNFAPWRQFSRYQSTTAGIWVQNQGDGTDIAYISVYIVETGKELYFWTGTMYYQQDKIEEIELEAPGADHPVGVVNLRLEAGYLAGPNRIAQSEVTIHPVEILP